MQKYILKRLLISIFILLGVSVIIYTLVRMMPADYVDNKFSSQLQNGAISQDDIDRFKELYGISMPDAYITVDIASLELETNVDGEAVVTNYGGEYARSVRSLEYDTNVQNEEAMQAWLVGTYKHGDYALDLLEGGSATLKRSYYETQLVPSHDSDGNVVYDADGQPVMREKEVLIKETVATGSYTANVVIDGVNFNVKLDLTLKNNAVETTTGYRVATFWDKLGSVLGGYFGWLGNLARGDLGTSFKYDKPVAQVITENMWISFAIAVIATILQFLISIPLGISSATHQYSARDYIVTVLTMIGISFPTYFFASIVIKLFAVDLGWLPSTGLISAGASYADNFAGQMQKLGDMARHLVLPIFVSVILSIGGLMRYTRTNTLEVLSADYIRTARAKGLSENKVIYRHAFRNTLIPLATLLAGILPSLFGGMMITEQVFGIPGIGNLAYQALKAGDVPFIMGYNMFLAVLTVLGTLFSDIMYSIVDPRVKLGK